MTEDTMNTHTLDVPPTAEDTSYLVRAYGLLLMGLLVSLIPVWYISGFGMALALVGVIYTYTLRNKVKDAPLSANHRRWIIRTFWMSSLLFLIAMLVSAFVIATNVDSSSVERIVAAVSDGSATPDEIAQMSAEFNETNKGVLLWSNIIAYAPGVAYMGARLVKGYRLLDAYQPVAKVTTWLV